jgi:hypothetical protein
MVLIMSHIDDRRHTPDNLSLSARQEELYLSMLKEGILTRIEKGFAFEEKRWNPMGIVGVDLPGKLEEGIDLARLYGNNVDGRRL